MLKMILPLLALVLSPFAQAADSKDPCAPTYKAQDSRLACRADGLYYSIVIHTLMSPPSAKCSGAKYKELISAEMKISGGNGGSVPMATVNFEPGAFNHQLGGVQDGFFHSEALNLDLTGCVSPMHGGVSAGN